MRCFSWFSAVFSPRLSVLTLAVCLVLPAPAFCVEIPEELFQACLLYTSDAADEL